MYSARLTTFHAKTDWLASVTARLGYAWDPRWLRLRQRRSRPGPTTSTPWDYLGTWAASETRSGWTVGGGLEWAFADNWSAKLEYQFYDFGTKDLAFFSSDFAGGPTTVVESVKQQIHTVKLGLNYRFALGR